MECDSIRLKVFYDNIQNAYQTISCIANTRLNCLQIARRDTKIRAVYEDIEQSDHCVSSYSLTQSPRVFAGSVTGRVNQ